jgi:hypothetical protein
MNRKILLLSLFLSAAALFSGCAGHKQQMYYWGDYSKTLYNCRKNPCKESLLKHKADLESIIEVSNKKSLRVPPGVYAELGYIYFRQNNKTEALRYFALEEKTYPESTIFMKRMAQAVKEREPDKTAKGKEQ